MAEGGCGTPTTNEEINEEIQQSNEETERDVTRTRTSSAQSNEPNNPVKEFVDFTIQDQSASDFQSNGWKHSTIRFRDFLKCNLTVYLSSDDVVKASKTFVKEVAETLRRMQVFSRKKFRIQLYNPLTKLRTLKRIIIN